MPIIATTEAAAELDREGLQAAIEHAARLVHPVWPIGRFIAVNPLGGLEDQPFEQAGEVAEAAFGARVALTEDRFREAYEAGRIASADLDRAIRARVGTLVDAPVSVVSRRCSALEILRADLLHGAPAPAPARTLRTPAERLSPAVADRVDTLVAKWCAVYLDRGQSGWPMPGAAAGLYAAWRPLAASDRSVSAGVRARLRALPDRADDALLELLAELRVDAESVVAVLEAELTRLPGWAGHLRWSAMHEGRAGLDELLALRLAYEAALLAEQGLLSSLPAAAPDPAAEPIDAGRRAQRALAHLSDGRSDAAMLEQVGAVLEALPERDRRWVWLEAYEEQHRRSLLDALRPVRPAQSSALTARPAAQLVCCIDTRSEGLRRHFEAVGAYETFGFAGFFAVAMRFHDLAGHAPTDQCPVLLSPAHDLIEQVSPGAERLAVRHRAAHEAARAAKSGASTAKRDVAAPFALAEATGWFSGPLAAVRTLSAGPFGRARARLAQIATPAVPTDLPVETQLDLTERVSTAEATLRTMGFVERFAPIVVLCGHRSGTENNPYGAALDCGACGGHGGAPNARAAVTILNAADVREGLRVAGIDVPGDTWFVAAEHDTAADVVTLLDEHRVPASHREALEDVRRDLQRAGERLSAERLTSLPGHRSQRSPQRRPDSPARAAANVRARGSDWAQVYPEWGLAGNAAMIVGPRSITRGLDLGRRTFLHSYEARHDPSGAALESILTAPLVVAQWINAQYYFSSVDPEHFGAGTKTIHNAVGGIGVLSGGSGDLRRGLPWQSVGEGNRLVHEPVRLLAVVQAPTEMIDAIVERTPLLQRLIGNGWIALAARADAGDAWLRRTDDGWTAWLAGQSELSA